MSGLPYKPSLICDVKTDAIKSTYAALTPEERAPVDKAIKYLANRGIKFFGEESALEFIGKLGLHLAEGEVNDGNG